MARKLAFYGTGDRAQPYLRALARRADVQLVAVCDLDPRAAEHTAAGWQARVFQRCDDMLQEARPDALWICVEPHLQGNVILKAAEMGIPFFVEPPGAVDFAQATACARLVNEKNLVTAVGYGIRHTDVVSEAKEYLDANQVPIALCQWMRPADSVTAAATLWTDAGRLVEALRFFCGDVTRVRALPATDGGIVVQLEFASGSVGTITCTTFARIEPRIELELLGDGWSLLFGDDFRTLELVEKDKVTIIRRQNDPAADQAFEFMDAVAAGDPAAVRSSYPDALHTMAICHAASVSARTGQALELASLEPFADQALPTPTA
jgi:myo-inositol 2-dehydrogenase / D-chiro-inositol 1-dehydrogenase